MTQSVRSIVTSFENFYYSQIRETILKGKEEDILITINISLSLDKRKEIIESFLESIRRF